MNAETWVEITRREAVAAQAQAATGCRMAWRVANADPGQLRQDMWVSGFRHAVTTAQRWAYWWAQDARHAHDVHLQALASEAAIPKSLAAA